jgi:type I restriction enzyme, S subunit
LGYFTIANVLISTNQGFIPMVCDDRVSNYYLLSVIENKMGEIESLTGAVLILKLTKPLSDPYR